MLKACNINVNSLAGKCGFMKNLILAESIDVVAVTETWLTESCNSSFVMIDGYSIFRGDLHEARCSIVCEEIFEACRG